MHVDDHAEAVVALPGGLMRAQDGHSLDLRSDRAEPGDAVPLAFTVTGPDGKPVRRYDVVHGRRLHLIVVRRDLPASSTCTLRSTRPPAPGRPWSPHPRHLARLRRLPATGGQALMLGADLFAAGDFAPRALPPRAAPRRSTATPSARGDLTPAGLTALPHGQPRRPPVTDLQPYLGAYGHLVALRQSDLAYLHVHPDAQPARHRPVRAGIAFTTEVPTAGTYRLFLDFRHDGAVRTAEFTILTMQDG